MSSFTCNACGRSVAIYMTQCPKCQKWNTFDRSYAIGQAPTITTGGAVVSTQLHVVTDYPTADEIAKFPLASPQTRDDVDPGGVIDGVINFEPMTIEPIRITDVQGEDLERTLTGLEPFDRVLGGGLVTASVVLLGGSPGAGKSTLMAQAIAAIGKRVLYVTGEETIGQATMRARRVNATHPEIWIVPSNDVDEAIAYARKLGPAIVCVDSIQTLSCNEVGGCAGSVSQVRECTLRLARYAKTEGVTVIIVGHVTKDGALAGPNTLQHLVDVVLLLDCADVGNRRTLRADGKNRFGSTVEVGVFEMTAAGMICIEPEITDARPPGDLADMLDAS